MFKLFMQTKLFLKNVKKINENDIDTTIYIDKIQPQTQ